MLGTSTTETPSGVEDDCLLKDAQVYENNNDSDSPMRGGYSIQRTASTSTLEGSEVPAEQSANESSIMLGGCTEINYEGQNIDVESGVPESAMPTDCAEMKYSNESVENRVTFNESLPLESDVQKSRHSRKCSVFLRKSANMKSQFSPSALKLLEELDSDDKTEDISDSTFEEEKGAPTRELSCFKRLFLNPSYSLLTQMLLIFGTVTTVTILFIMITVIIAVVATGSRASVQVEGKAEYLVKRSLGSTARYVAEAISPRIIPEDVINIMAEFLEDRFVGYPNEDESEIPFFDVRSGTNIYPLIKDYPPFDWDFRKTPDERGNVNDKNSKEHVQERWPLYMNYPRLSTADACFIMQGACDPRAANSSELGYYPNCTDENNDLATGGVVVPTPTNAHVARKAAVLSPLLKAIYEYHQDFKELGYYFANGGSGLTMFFPHYEANWNNSHVSIGCDWMREPNPINADLGPIGTEEEIGRCRTDGTKVNSRDYNPLERGWCRDQALNPKRIRSIGPFQSAWNPGEWLMLTGRAVYDPITGSFVACMGVTFTIGEIQNILDDSDVDEWGASATLARWDDGTVVVSPKFDLRTAAETTFVFDPALETGVNLELFDDIKSLVNFSLPWDPDVVKKKFENERFQSEDRYIFAYPIPAIPDYYDPNYYPEFVTIMSSKKSEVMASVREVSASVDQEVRKIVRFTVVFGVIGIGVIISVIFSAASYLTEPLRWMSSVGKKILRCFGEEEINFERQSVSRFAPKTELNVLVNEFTDMISRFSGKGTAKRAKKKEKEVLNEFDLFVSSPALVDALYGGRKNAKFPFNYKQDYVKGAKKELDGMPSKINYGKNVQNEGSLSSKSTNISPICPNEKKTNITKSTLFRWIVTLIIGPLLFFSLIISIVTLWMLSTLPQLIIDPLTNELVSLESSYAYSATVMRALLTTHLTEKAVRDLHIATRYATWISFGALNTSDSFTEMLGGAEECKSSDSFSSCSWLMEQPCDCAWNDVQTDRECSDFNQERRSRSLQKIWFAQLKEGSSWPDGTRNFSTFPAIATSPNTTEWWSNVSALPNKVLPDESDSQSRIGTSYGKAETLSAMSAVLIPLYNYNTNKERPIEYYISFENDGMTIGYSGCTPASATFPFWQSKDENGAHQFRPEICPISKYGYDPRCREWYDECKTKAQSHKTFLHINSPYLFQDGMTVAQTVSSALINPGTDEFFGSTMISFAPDLIMSTLYNETRLSSMPIPVLVTVPKLETVVGPGYSLSKESQTIELFVLPFDDCEYGNDCEKFLSILTDMKEGKNGSSSFTRTSSSGDKETVHISYAPIFVQSIHAVDSSDFSRGVRMKRLLVYSLGLAESNTGILQSQKIGAFEDFVETQIIICIAVLSVVLVFALMVLIFAAYQVASTSIVGPILTLLTIIQAANRTADIEHLDMINLSLWFLGSCKEIDSVYRTMDSLLNAVRSANVTFYEGDLEKAYKGYKDSLRMFTKLKNKKALAIASTNLGNTLLTAYRIMMQQNEKSFIGMSKEDVASEGTNYYSVAIKLGEEEYDRFYNEQGWSEECLAFMQSLANRYFNRALFVLSSKEDHEHPKKAEAMGFRDIQITADMDLEIVDQCIDMGFKIDRVERHELMISRSRGILALIKLGYPPEEFFIDELISELLADLKRALKNPGDELFRDTSPAGRMQILDVELMKYCRRRKKSSKEASEVAIRMLVEDEYIFPTALLKAVKTLLSYLTNIDSTLIIDKGNKEDLIAGLTEYVQEIDANIALRAVRATDTSVSVIGSDLSLKNIPTANFEFSCGASIATGKMQTSEFNIIDYRKSTSIETGRGDFSMEEY